VTEEPDWDFEMLRQQQIHDMSQDELLQDRSTKLFQRATDRGYSYHFDVLGRPIIQFPQDIVALNELIWRVRPDIVVETGIARGGSVLNTASQLALLDLADSSIGIGGGALQPKRKVIAVDIDIRPPNREALNRHFLAPWFELIEGSSVDTGIVGQVTAWIEPGATVMVLLDSNHTHAHVLDELHAYAPLVSEGSYCIVYDTIIEHLPHGYFSDRPWDVGNNPATAVQQFLRERDDFVVDGMIDQKLLLTVAPGGYLKRIAGESR
jgi:cephalosporin hydroxylase